MSVTSCLEVRLGHDGHALEALIATQNNGSQGCDTPMISHDQVRRSISRICSGGTVLQYADRSTPWIGQSYPSGAECCLEWEVLNPPQASPTVPNASGTGR